MTISEVSRKYGLTQDTLRYYERIGLIPRVGRNAGGKRDYAQEDQNWVSFIKCMRGAGIPIEVLIEYVALFQQGEDTRAARRELLIEQRAQLVARIADMNEVLEKLNGKIERYEHINTIEERNLRSAAAE